MSSRTNVGNYSPCVLFYRSGHIDCDIAPAYVLMASTSWNMGQLQYRFVAANEHLLNILNLNESKHLSERVQTPSF